MPSNELRPFIARHVHPHQSLSAQYLRNFKKKVIKYISVYGVQRDVSHNHATSLLSNSVTEETIGTDSSINRKHVESLLLNAMGKGDLWDVVKFFEGLQDESPLFCFSLKRNDNGQPEAIMWCTAEMRRDLIRYSSSLFIDMRKTATNTIGWNYFGPSVKDCDLKVRVVGECLCCAETNDMYAWGLQQLQKFESRYQLSSTKFLFADNLITEDLLLQLGINATCTL